MNGFIRVAAVTPKVAVANPRANAESLLEHFRTAEAQGAQIVIAPELALTGATCGDLFGLAALETQTQEALRYLCENLPANGVYGVGLPLRHAGCLYNVVAILQGGKVLGYVPKAHLAPAVTSAERRYFTAGTVLEPGATHDGVPFGTDLCFELAGARVGVVIGEALDCATLSPAHLILNPTAVGEVVGQAANRREWARLQTARAVCAIASAGAGMGESTTDGVFSGHRILANNGRVIAESRWSEGVSLMDFNPAWADFARRRAGISHSASAIPHSLIACSAVTSLGEPFADGSHAGLKATPFVPQDADRCTERCEEILTIQSAALAKRFTHTRAKRLVLGLSGGLDSTLALLVCARMCRDLGLSPETILAVTMPGFGTSGRTRGNVDCLTEALGVELREIPIASAVEQHFKDIAHDPAVQDVTYENAQARMRTLILMDLANQEGGLLVGTGDLSEIALGWSTYNGDHMSMYSVNCGVPKTLMRACVLAVARQRGGILAEALEDICATPVSPELLPGAQPTEDLVGAYELHDCFLYYLLKYGCAREQLAELAALLWGKQYDAPTRERTLDIFCRRFIQQQFKRSASPDGPKVGTIALSPRGDWCVPSDAALQL